MTSVSDSPRGSVGTRPEANVWIDHVTTRGFRSIENLAIDLEPTTTYLVGENNTGKTSLLLAISAVLGAYRPGVDDLTRRNDGTTAEHAEVEVRIRPSQGSTFGDHERGALGGNVHTIADDPHEVAWIKAVFSASREGGQLLVQRSFLQPGRRELVKSPAPFLASALDLFQCELLDASRDLVADLGNKSSRWGRLLFDLQIPELPEEDGKPHRLSRSTMEAALKTLASDMREASPVLSELELELSRLAQVQNTVGNVTLLPFPPQIEEIMRSVDILLSHGNGPGLPLRFHGLGSRSLASIFVFSTLCSLRLGADQGLRPHFLTLVEEPESHLHPQAITALRSQLDQLPGQRIVSTHSTTLVSEASPGSLRVLRRHGQVFTVHRLSKKSIADTARFRRFVERPFGEFFFSRLVIFGDGAAERDALPILLTRALGASPAALGVTIVDCESMNHPQIPKLIAAADELGLPWIVFTDNDPAGLSSLTKIVDPDTGVGLETDSLHVVMAGAKAMEQLLLDAGYGDEVAEVARREGENAVLGADQLKYLKKHKGWVGEAVASLALENNKQIPAPIVDLAQRVRRFLADTPSTTGSVDRT